MDWVDGSFPNREKGIAVYCGECDPSFREEIGICVPWGSGGHPGVYKGVMKLGREGILGRFLRVLDFRNAKMNTGNR